MTPPVLFLIFNRPDLTQISFAQIREARPSRLFVAADGPRAGRDGEAELCEEARRIVDQIDWACQVKTLFRDHNLGCRQAVSSAITWFFEHVEEGIILEDDCVADSTFFQFCGELLERFRHDPRVMTITGNNFQDGQVRGDASYYFSMYSHIWGWATWRRAWTRYDCHMENWLELREVQFLRGFLSDEATLFWTEQFDAVYNGKVDTWDSVWLFSSWAHHGMTATPNINLVSNIGFGERATHTFSCESPIANMPRCAMTAPLKHPTTMFRHYAADAYTTSGQFRKLPAVQPPSIASRIAGKLHRTYQVLGKESVAAAFKRLRTSDTRYSSECPLNDFPPNSPT